MPRSSFTAGGTTAFDTCDRWLRHFGLNLFANALKEVIQSSRSEIRAWAGKHDLGTLVVIPPDQPFVLITRYELVSVAMARLCWRKGGAVGGTVAAHQIEKRALRISHEGKAAGARNVLWFHVNTAA